MGVMVLTAMAFGMGAWADPESLVTPLQPSAPYYSQQLGDGSVGSESVGPHGDAAYSYPMGLVSAQYSSEGGWSVGGASVIGRSTKWGVPAYGTNDIYTLDGDELAVQSIFYHTARENYHRIIQQCPNTVGSFWEVTAQNGTLARYGATPDSRVERTGIASDDQPRLWAVSYVSNQVTKTVIRYFYHEDNGQGLFYLTNIVAGKMGAAANGYRRTTLYYEPQPRTYVNYRSGTRVIDSKRVKSVVEYIGCDANGMGGSIVRAFKIQWGQTSLTKQPVIISITPYGTNATVDASGTIMGDSSLPPTTFDYLSSTPGFTSEQDWGAGEPAGDGDLRIALTKFDTYYGSAYTYGYHELIDVDGDTLPDIAHMNDGDTYASVSFNSGSGFRVDSYEHWPRPAGIDSLVKGSSYLTYFLTLSTIADINGDGWVDLFTGGTLHAGGGRGRGFDSSQVWTTESNPTAICGTEYGNYTISDLIDMNGDGLLDYFTRGAAGDNNYYLYANRQGHFVSPVGMWSGDIGGLRAHKITTSDPATDPAHKGVVRDIVDLNGDGLPDRVSMHNSPLTVSYNTGSGFADAVTCSAPSYPYLKREDQNLNVLEDMLDVNGDGLVDFVQKNGSSPLMVAFNNGAGFEDPIPWGADPKEYLRRGTKSACFVGRVKYTGVACIQDLIDMNGDGMVDIVCKKSGQSMKVMLSTAGPDGLLWKVHNSAGGVTEFSYRSIDRSKNPSYHCKKWVVDSLVYRDALTADVRHHYAYYNGLHVASNREDRGFGKVVVTDPAGNTTETHYHQDDSFAGLVKKQIVRDAAGHMYSYVCNTYEDLARRYAYWGNVVGTPVTQNRPLAGPPVVVKAPKLVRQDTYIIPGQQLQDTDAATQPIGSNFKRLKTCYDYDVYGQPLVIENFGEVDPISGNDIGADNVRIEFGNLMYADTWDFAPEYKRVKGTDGQSATYSKTFTEFYRYSAYPQANLGFLDYSYLPPHPYLKAIYQQCDGQRITTQYAYDDYGNLAYVSDDHWNTTLTSYDPIYRSYPVAVTNFTYADWGGTQLSENYEYDSLKRLTGVRDANGVWTRMTFDAFGRPTSLIESNDTPTYPTVRITYNDTAFPNSVIVTQRQFAGSTATLATYSYKDGLGRVIQTKNQAVDQNGTAKWRTMDFWEYYEGNAKVSAQTAPYFTGNATYSTRQPGQYETCSFLADGHGPSTVSYNPDGTHSSVYGLPLKNRHINERGYGVEEVVDGLGRVREVVKYSDTGLTTVYRRDTFQYETAWGNVLKSIEDVGGANLTRTAQYDGFGRMTSVIDPDSGTHSCTYDKLGNVLTRTDPMGRTTYYTYGPLNRLQKVSYPDGTIVSNRYDNYAGTGAGPYSLGRLTMVTDPSGSTVFRYDARGRITNEVKTIVGGGTKTNAYVYDSMDRATRITYPDGSIVSNTYDGNGWIKSVGSASVPTRYLATNTYSELGATLLRKLGNGAFDLLTYRPASENFRLFTAQSCQANNANMRGNAYYYDPVGNIASLTATPDTYRQEFAYDHLNRLTAQTHASYVGGILNYTYDALDNIRTKTTDGQELSYTYNPSRPHAVVGTSDAWTYEYDANGNMKCRLQTAAIEPPPPPSSYLIARWTFEEGSGTTVRDVSGNGHDGVIQGGATWAVGNPGHGLRFDGIDDFVSVANAAGIPAGNEAYTIEAWIKPESMGARGIIGWGRFDNAGQMNSVRLTDWGLLNSWFANDLWVSAPGLVGNWHHVAAVYDGTTRSVYLDGVRIGSDTPGTHTATAENLVLGRDCFTSYFHGTIDELSVWRGARTPGEVARDSESILNPSSLAAWWSFSENGGTVAHDGSGNGNHGTLQGGTFNGVALELDGVDDLVTVANLTGIPEGDQPYTIAASVTPFEMGARGIVGWGVYGVNNGANALRLTDSGVMNYWWENDLSVAAVPGTVAVTYDGKTRSIYVNGVLVDSDTPTSPHAVTPQGFTIGRTCVSEYFKGHIDEVAIWRRALSANEVYTAFGEANRPQLAARWTFDEGSGTTLYDSSGNGNHGTISGATRVAGKQGKALRFDGIDDLVSVATMAGIPTNDQTFSITAWIKPETMKEGGIVGWGVFTSLGRATGLKLSVGGLIDTWGLDDLDVPTSTLTGGWHHVAVTFDGIYRMHTIYLDGAPIAYEVPSTTHNAQSTNLKIGRTTDRMGVNEFFKGAIDEVAIWRGTLSREEILYQYQQLNKNLPDLAARWTFDEGSGTTVRDSSGNGNNGRINGATWAPGILRNALRFDGVDDYVGFDECFALPDGDIPYTIEAWIKPEPAEGSHYIVMWGDPNFNRMNSLNYGDNTGSGSILDSWGSGAYVFADTSDLAGNWHHVLSSYDGTNVSIYVDGMLMAREPASITRGSFCKNLKIGRGDHASSGYFKGLIDELCVWRKAMNEGDAQRRFAAVTATSYAYDCEDRLINVESASFSGSYLYDYSGRRVKKTENGITTYYFSSFYEVENGTPIKYYYADGQLIAQDKGGTLSYFHGDHLSGIARVTDAAGNEVRRMEYLPYGQTIVSSGNPGTEPKYQYTGQEKDGSGLYYYGARFYDPKLGRFLTLDPLGDDYCYALNNPIMFNDPSGMTATYSEAPDGATAVYPIDNDVWPGGAYCTFPSGYLDSFDESHPVAGGVGGSWDTPEQRVGQAIGDWIQGPIWQPMGTAYGMLEDAAINGIIEPLNLSPGYRTAAALGIGFIMPGPADLATAPRKVSRLVQMLESGKFVKKPFVPDVEVDLSGMTKDDIMQMLMNLSVARGGLEHGLLRNAQGKMMVRCGGPRNIPMQDNERILAHTHPDTGRLSLGDVLTMMRGEKYQRVQALGNWKTGKWSIRSARKELQYYKRKEGLRYMHDGEFLDLVEDVYLSQWMEMFE
jgi:RHS repeat-associated protein